ncbi:TPA: hypothetical protein QDB01_000975 [Burkholderia vietnamiensis]|nr:hypothetical protein [Burkholderia vietnamiensis]
MNLTALSAITTALSGPTSAFRIIPSGAFRAQDGRPINAPAWKMDNLIAQTLIQAANARTDDYLIDFEHASLSAQGPVPAAGWFKQLEWREGDGLFVVGARWTDRAKAMLQAGEYRYVSPVFSYAADGTVTALLSIALTNNPALSGLTDLGAIAINSRTNSGEQANTMQNNGLTKNQSDYFRNLFGFDPASLSGTQSTASLSSRREATTGGMSDRSRENFAHVFGFEPK